MPNSRRREGPSSVAGAEECYPIWKQRLDTNTLVTTPNSDLVYTMSTWTGARTVGSCSGRRKVLTRLPAWASDQHEQADEPGHTEAFVTHGTARSLGRPKLLRERGCQSGAGSMNSMVSPARANTAYRNRT